MSVFLQSTCAVVIYTQMYIPHGKITGKLSYIYTFPESIRVEERDLSGMVKDPTFLSLPGHRYLKLGSKSNLHAEISGSIVWYEALASRQRLC